MKNVLKVNFKIANIHHLNKSLRFLKNPSTEEAKAPKNLVKKDIVMKKAEKGDDNVIVNRSDYISKLSKNLQDTSKFKRVNIEEGNALNYFIHNGRANHTSPQIL